ncbi:MAG TPA: hypothetical protein PLS69_00420 [Terricaulis sp.]|nr:hypothetical protein [Terricaulis sp.]HRP11007.1 hypothetical protein [Terricaulis sp.]
MPADRKAFALRLDPALYNAVARLAGAELRSVNAEIEFLLREALRARGVKIEPPPEDETGEAK